MKPEMLTEFGLTKNESLLYLTLLKIGESKVSELIKGADFKSGKIYQVLDSLINKGLVSYIIKNNVKFYVAQNPKKLYEYITMQKLKLEKQEDEFTQQLPQLEHMYKENKDLCSVKVYEGVVGIRTAMFQIIEKLPQDGLLVAYGCSTSEKRDVILQWRRCDELLKKKNITYKAILSWLTPEHREIRRKDPIKSKNRRYLKATDVSNFVVGENITILFNFEEPNCIVIENLEYANQFKILFNVLWKVAEPL